MVRNYREPLKGFAVGREGGGGKLGRNGVVVGACHDAIMTYRSGERTRYQRVEKYKP